MPRQLRIQYAGAVYHVLARGDRREDIVHDDEDLAMFVATLAEACKKTGWEVLAWVLMDNHYHWLIRTPEPNLVEGMKRERCHVKGVRCFMLRNSRNSDLATPLKRPSRIWS